MELWATGYGIALARSLGIAVAYLPGLAMHRIADLHPGEGKADARDAYVIAELTVLAGYDDDLAAQCTG